VSCWTDKCLETIISVKLNAPGSWDDARVAYRIYDELLEHTLDGFYLIADTGFPWGTASIEGWIVAPMKAGQTITGTQEEIEEKAVFDCEVISY
jgi:hypothetical protein